ncbi:MAG: hypothetical protein IPN75_11575 [Dechloromonas sp.]|uniref:Uncharacterized protein n=1 Tax=Candidatus Dechloromonas phosphorivorans TaxID=2899244 RepID=A0A9D7QI33_9RHOO|nr:hypothetical protein [Candidatus Dechloromonas phosphorivorans]
MRLHLALRAGFGQQLVHGRHRRPGAAAVAQMHPGEKRDDLVEHADDEGHEAADQQQDAGKDAPAGQVGKRRPGCCGQHHGQGKNGAHQPKLPVAIGDVAARPPALRLQPEGEQGEADAGDRRQGLDQTNCHCRLNDDTQRPGDHQPEHDARKPPAWPRRVAGVNWNIGTTT